MSPTLGCSIEISRYWQASESLSGLFNRESRYIYLYHSYYGNSHVIKVIISLQNFLGIRYHPCATFLYFLWYKIVIPWQHRDYRTITSLSLGLRSRESGQLSTIIPQNHGITTRKMVPITGRASS